MNETCNQAHEPLLKRNRDEGIQKAEIQLTKAVIAKKMPQRRKDLEEQLTRNSFAPLAFRESSNALFIEIEFLKYEEFLSNLKWKALEEFQMHENRIKKLFLKESINNLLQQTEKFLKDPFMCINPPRTTIINNKIRDIILFPDQRRLLICRECGEILLHDISKNKLLFMTDIKETIFVVALNPLGNTFMVGTNKGNIIIFNNDFQELCRKRIIQKEKVAIKAISFSVEGHFILVGSDLGRLSAYKFKENELALSNEILYHEDGVLSIAFSTLGKLYASGGYDGSIKIFTFEEDSAVVKILRTLNIHKNAVNSLSFSQNGEFLLTGSFDKIAKLVDSNSGKVLKEYRGHSESIYTVEISKDGNYVLTGSQDNSAKLFDRKTGNIIYEFTNPGECFDGERFDIGAVRFFQDSSKLITAGEGVVKIFKVFNVEEKQYYRGYSNYTDFQINCIDLSPSLLMMLSGGNDGRAKLLDLETGFELASYEGGGAPVNVVKFSPDSANVLTGGEDSLLRLYQTYSGALVRSFRDNSGSIHSIIFAKKIPEFATGGDDCLLNIYNSLHYERIVSKESGIKKEEYQINEIKNKGFRIRSMFYSPDDEWIVAGGFKTENDGSNSAKVAFIARTSHDIKIFEYGEGIIYDMEYVGNKYLVVLKENVGSGESNSLFISFIEKFDFIEKKLNKVEKKIMDSNIYSIVSENNLLFCVSDTNEDKEIRQLKYCEVKNGALGDWSVLYSNKNIKSEPVTNDMSTQAEIEIGESKQTSRITSNILFLKDFIVAGTSTGKPLILSKPNNIPNAKLLEIPIPQVFEIVNLDIHESSMVGILDKENELNILNLFSGQSWTIPRVPSTDVRHKCIKFSKLESHLFVGSEDGSLRVYNIETNKWFDIEIETNTNPSPVEQIESISYGNITYIFTVFRNNFIAFMSFSEQDINDRKPKSRIIDTGTRLSYFEKDILVLSPRVTKPKKEKLAKDNSIIELLVLLRNGSIVQLIVKLYPETKVTIKDTEKNTAGFKRFSEKFLFSRLLNLTCARNAKNFSKIIMGGRDKLVRIYDVKTKGETIFSGHEDNICDVDFLTDLKYAVSASDDNIIKIFNIKSGNVIFEHKSIPKINMVNVAQSVDSILLSTVNGLQIIDRALTWRGKIERFNESVENAKQNTLNVIETIDSTIFQELPININLSPLHINLAFSNEQNDEIELLNKISEFLSPKSKADSKSKKLLCDCIFEESFQTTPWDIWIESSKDRKSQKQMKMIYENLIKILLCPEMTQTDKMNNKPDFIADVAKMCPTQLQDVLDAFWQRAETITITSHRMNWYMSFQFYWDIFLGIIDVFNLKKTKLNRTSFPIVLHSKSPVPCSVVLERNYEMVYEAYKLSTQQDLAQQNDYRFSKQHVTIYVKISKIKLDEFVNLDYYKKNNSSTENSAFLPELFSSFQPDDPLFKSEKLAVVVSYLWNLRACIGYTFYRRVLTFIMFQVLVCMNCLYVIPERQNKKGIERSKFEKTGFLLDSTILFFLSLGFVMRSFKIIQMYCMYGRKNLRYSNVFSFWKLLDLVICLLGFALFGLDIYWTTINMDDDKSVIVITKCLLALFFATTWFKLIEFARGFSRTSALLRLLSQVTYDMSAYLLIILFFVIGLAFSSFILQDSYSEHSLWHYFKISYGIVIGNSGEYKDEEQALNSELYFVLLFFASVYVVIIMLNLLIAIVNNSFGNVLAREKQNEIYEKLKIIYDHIYELDEIEKEDLKKVLQDDYLFQLSAVNDEQVQDEQITKLNQIEEAMSNQKTEVQTELNACNQRITEVSVQLSQIQSMLNEIMKNQQNPKK